MNIITVTMLQVLLFSLVTTSSAFTTHKYDDYDKFGNYRPSAPQLDNIFGYDNSNGRRPVQMYEYAKRYDGVVISDVYQGPSGGADRRIDMPYSYQNPYQWNREVPWNRVAVTEPAKFFNRFEGLNQDNPDTRYGQPVVQQNKEEDVSQKERTDKLNETQGNASVPQISTQSDVVGRTLVSTEQKITWNNDHEGLSEDNGNITARSVNSDKSTNSLNVHEHDKQNADKTKTDDRTANKNNNLSDNTANDTNKYSTKTTQDNEVTPRTQDPRTKPSEDDVWIWSNGEDQIVETTTLNTLDDRAAFSGNGCPMGMTKIGNTCVVKD